MGQLTTINHNKTLGNPLVGHFWGTLPHSYPTAKWGNCFYLLLLAFYD